MKHKDEIDSMKLSASARLASHIRSSLAAGPRVWALVLVILTAAAIAAAATWDRVAVEPSYAVVPWLLVPAFILVESFPVHLQFRSETASFSMLEIPLVVGLFAAGGRWLLLAILVGTLIPLALIRRQPFVKLAFNLSNLVLQTAVALLLFDFFRSGSSPLDLNVSVAAVAATATSSTLNMVLLTCVLLASERTVNRRRFINTLTVATIVGVTNTAIGLIAVVLLNSTSWAISLLGVPLAVLLVSYRAFVSERTQREQVEFIYAATKSLHETDGREVGIETLVREAASMFRASQVQLLLFPSADGSTPAVQFGIAGLDADVQVDANPSLALAMTVAEDLADARLVNADDRGPVRDLLDTWGISEAMVVTLISEENATGLLAIADRFGTVGGFGTEDLRLFKTLAYHTSTALENDRLGQALAQLQTLERELSHLATHDPLTGLPNRLQLRQHLDQLASQGKAKIELMFIDLDDFKFVNDTYGHSVGDELLREVGRRIHRCMRSTDIAARLGGDEFAVVVQPAGAAQAMAERIIEAVAVPMVLDGNTVAVGCSIGVANATGTTAGVHLLRQADVAMYAAKKRGKGRVALYSPEVGEELAAHQRLQQRVRAAIANDELRVYYQPIYGLSTNRMVGAEALVRWESPEGLRPAGEFLPVVEEGGFISQVDRWVLSTALQDLRRLGDTTIWHSVNLSVRSLQEDDVVDFIVGATASAGVDPKRVVIEVTETAAMHDIDENVAKLEQLSNAGFGIALDDFGTGYSSINHLRQLPVDLLKVAQPFVADLGIAGGETFIRAIINLGQTLGLEVVAEGIETRNQLDELCLLSCDFGQGFLLDRPMTADDLRNRVAEMTALSTS